MVTAIHRIAKAPDARTFCGDTRLLRLEAAIDTAFANDRVEKAPQSISNTAWAFAKLGIHNQPLFQAIASEAIKTLS